jgi:hypothetical protein
MLSKGIGSHWHCGDSGVNYDVEISLYFQGMEVG